MDYFINKFSLNFIDILHSDIQGFELNILEGANISLVQNKIGYLFISTHSNKLHEACISTITKYKYEILCEADLDSSFSMDGLIVAKNKNYNGIESIDISKRSNI